METSDLVLLKKWLQSNKNFTYSFCSNFRFVIIHDFRDESK